MEVAEASMEAFTLPCRGISHGSFRGSYFHGRFSWKLPGNLLPRVLTFTEVFRGSFQGIFFLGSFHESLHDSHFPGIFHERFPERYFNRRFSGSKLLSQKLPWKHICFLGSFRDSVHGEFHLGFHAFVEVNCFHGSFCARKFAFMEAFVEEKFLQRKLL